MRIGHQSGREPGTSITSAERSGISGSAEKTGPQQNTLPSSEDIRRSPEDVLLRLLDDLGRSPVLSARKYNPLRAALGLIRQHFTGPENPEWAESSDALLMGRFLRAWNRRYGAELPTDVRKKLTVLEGILNPPPGRDPSDQAPFYVISGGPGEDPRNPRWTLRVERQPPRKEKEECRAVLDMECPQLGRIRTVLTLGTSDSRCLFYPSLRKTRRLLRGALKSFGRRLAGRGLPVPSMAVASGHQAEKEIGKKTGETGVRLWG